MDLRIKFKIYSSSILPNTTFNPMTLQVNQKGTNIEK